MNETAATTSEPRWSGLPFIAMTFVALNALILTLIAFGNITDPATNWDFVRNVMGMQTTNFGQAPGEGLDPNVMWHAITAEPLQLIGYIGIIVAETLAGVVLVVATVKWLRGFRNDTFQSARNWSNAGLLLIIAIFGIGFMAVGGEWFQMWRSITANGLDPALRYLTVASFALVFVNMPSPRWKTLNAEEVSRDAFR
jgi:predicted small integral membrane protein